MKKAIIPSLLAASLLLVAGCGDSKVKKTAGELIPKLFNDHDSVAEVICRNIRDFSAYQKNIWTGTAEIRLWVKVLIVKSEDGPVFVTLEDKKTPGGAQGENEPLDDGVKNEAIQIVPKVLQKWISIADSTCTDISSVVYSGSEYTFELGSLKAWTGTAAVEMKLPVVIRRSGDSIEVKPDSAGLGLRGGSESASRKDIEKMIQNGRQFVQALIAANIEREAQSLGTVWPSVENWKGKKATDYVEKLYDHEVLDYDGKPDDMMGWSIIAGIDDFSDETPFLVSSNVKIATKSTSGAISIADGHFALDTSDKIFGKEIVVFAKNSRCYLGNDAVKRLTSLVMEGKTDHHNWAFLSAE